MGLRKALLHPTVWLLALIMFACQTGSYGLSLWIPQIVKSLSGLTNLQVGLVSAIPYIGAAIGMVWIGMNSDRTGERFMHIAVPCAVAAVGFTASAFLQSPIPGNHRADDCGDRRSWQPRTVLVVAGALPRQPAPLRRASRSSTRWARWEGSSVLSPWVW